MMNNILRVPTKKELFKYYWGLVVAVLLAIAVYGFIGPYLISMPNDFGVLLGGVVVFCPPLLAIYNILKLVIYLISNKE